MKKNHLSWFLAILVLIIVVAGCRPTPPTRVTDGTIVLLRNGRTNAAFVVTKQSINPEVVDFSWFVRSDGKSTFDPKSPSVASGVVTGATSIAFGPFNIQWSSGGALGGYVYYPSQYRYPPIKLPLLGYRTRPCFGDPWMAVIPERDLPKVDAKDSRWSFLR